MLAVRRASRCGWGVMRLPMALLYGAFQCQQEALMYASCISSEVAVGSLSRGGRGTNIDSGLAPIAFATARTAVGRPMRRAIVAYDTVVL